MNDDINRAVAERVALQRRLLDRANQIEADGRKEFKDFDQRAQILHAVGADANLIDDVATVSKTPHRLIHDLTSDVQKAARIVGMDRPQRIAELTRLDHARSQPKPQPTSQPVRQAHWLEGKDEAKVTEDFYAMMKRRGERR